MRIRAVALYALLFTLCGLTAAQAAPTLTVGSASGQAGTTVNLPITFDPTMASVAGIQFNLTLPSALSTGTVTPGAILTTAGKSVSTNLTGDTWTFIIFGINLSTIGSGTLLTAQLTIAPGTAAGTLSVPVSNSIYSDPSGVSIVPGTSSPGSVTVVNNPPIVATPAAASPNPAAGTTTNLSVLGADDGGEANLTYTWAATGAPPAPVVFSANSTNAAKNTAATFTKAGAYSFQATIKDAGNLTTTSSVNVTVNQTATTITVSPASSSTVITGTVQFTATALDQFNNALTTPPSFSWTVSGGGSISAAGLFTAGAAIGGPFSVTATSGGKSGTANVTVLASPCDVNQDGATNVFDVQLEVNMALGVAACTTDINKDGLCNILDIQRVVNAALGGSCVTTP